MAEADAPEHFSFGVVPGQVVYEILTSRMADVVGLVKDAYLAHRHALASNPHSQFLTFADRPRDRIIALAADLRNGTPVAGVKWISSWPENVQSGLPRASAVIVLNRRDTGYPYAILEGSIISAVRTAGSAVLAAECLLERGPESRRRPIRIGFVGCGVIARHILDMCIARQWTFQHIAAFDLDHERAQNFLHRIGDHTATATARSHDELIEQSDMVVFATTAPKPYVTDPAPFRHRPLVLHISLRDLSPEIILGANNVVDDIDHCLRAETSPHLAEQRTGHRKFVNGTIAEAITNELVLDASRPTIVSPFGMGVLDLAVARFVYGEARRRNAVHQIPDFFRNDS